MSKLSSTTATVWAYPYQETSRGNCTTTRVDFYSVSTEGAGLYGGTVRFTHVDKSPSFGATVVSTTGSLFEKAVGTMRYKPDNLENSGCSWEGMHTHLEFNNHSVGGDVMSQVWTQQFSSETEAPYDEPYIDDPDYLTPGLAKCPTNDCGDYINNSPSNWTAKTLW